MLTTMLFPSTRVRPPPSLVWPLVTEGLFLTRRGDGCCDDRYCCYRRCHRTAHTVTAAAVLIVCILLGRAGGV